MEMRINPIPQDFNIKEIILINYLYLFKLFTEPKYKKKLKVLIN